MTDLGWLGPPKHHPTYMVHHGRCWARCSCNWRTDLNINGNQTWAQLEFAKHLTEATALADPKEPE